MRVLGHEAAGLKGAAKVLVLPVSLARFQSGLQSDKAPAGEVHLDVNAATSADRDSKQHAGEQLVLAQSGVAGLVARGMLLVHGGNDREAACLQRGHGPRLLCPDRGRLHRMA